MKLFTATKHIYFTELAYFGRYDSYDSKYDSYGKRKEIKQEDHYQKTFFYFVLRHLIGSILSSICSNITSACKLSSSIHSVMLTYPICTKIRQNRSKISPANNTSNFKYGGFPLKIHTSCIIQIQRLFSRKIE